MQCVIGIIGFFVGIWIAVSLVIVATSWREPEDFMKLLFNEGPLPYETDRARRERVIFAARRVLLRLDDLCLCHDQRTLDAVRRRSVAIVEGAS